MQQANQIRFRGLVTGLLFFLSLWMVTPVWGQGGESTDGVSADEVNAVARDLWCPLCSGVRLDACELKACDQMKEVIAIKLSEGADTESIKAYFLTQYGPQVLGEPPRSGFNWLAWILPFAVLAGGGVFLGLKAQRMAAKRRTAEAVIASPTDANPATADEEYRKQLDEELTRYG